MNSSPAPKSVTLDSLDKRIVRGLQISPRVPFRRLAEVLDVSERTVARRYNALYRAGTLRVAANVDPTALGESDWIVRVRTRPDAVLDLGRALAQRRDVAWVAVTAGGAEVVCSVRSHTQEQREHLLLGRLPRSGAVLDVALSVVLRRFVGGRATDLIGDQDVLTPDQVERLARDMPTSRRATSRVIGSLEPVDYAMLKALGRDGRASIGALARAAGISEGRAARRLETLLTDGVVYLHVDLSATALGYPVEAYLWLTVQPAAVEATCRALSEHPETLFVAAVTGRTNVIAWLTCRSLDDLYRYITERTGGLDGVREVEVAPVLRRLKQSGTRVDGTRLEIPG
ncbi:Lrp/AsnC family transcriptional regulator [Saccharothrix coeruleofusca]|uniref:Lrp/AsnC family transcriptional regulator n=1 Tax=Saccharothrix coeruleofusca TaxID=33919 RepID=UPI0027DB0490|nr:Lrp/AsnC family transcriptional regulator [Saccharothrix coeruleofusca]